jgi:hypothetical protein
LCRGALAANAAGATEDDLLLALRRDNQLGLLGERCATCYSGGALFFAVLICQFAFVAWTFPLSELMSSKPMFHIDSAWHLYHVKLGANLMRTHSLVGYDPFFNAGYPGGVTYNWSAKFPVLLAILFKPWLDEIVAYKLFVFVSATLAPACVPLAMRWLGFEYRAVVAGSALGLILWWASVFRWYHTAGMVSFVFGSYLALPYVARIINYFEGRGNWGCLAGLGLVGAIALFYHPLFPIPIIGGVIVYLAFDWQAVSRLRTWLLLLMVPFLAILPNLLWLYPMDYYHRIFSVGVGQVSPYQQLVDINIAWKEFLGLWSGNARGSKLYLPFAVAAAWACFAVRGIRERRIVASFTCLGCCLVLFAVVGAASSAAANVQPNRFSPVGYLFLAIPASFGLVRLWQSVIVKRRPWRELGALWLVLGVITIPVAYAANEVKHEIRYAAIGHYGAIPPEVKGLGDRSVWIINWLKTNTTNSGRVLFETSKARVHDGGHLAGFYAYTTGREFIGGPYPFHHFAGFWDGYLFGRPIEKMEHEQLRKYIELYNIGWAIVHSEQSKKVLDKMPGVGPVGQYKELKVYAINQHLSYFIRGSGRVAERDHNRLLLDDLSGEDVIVKYHYVDGLKSEPFTRLMPIYLLEDPNPFIRIQYPPKTLSLYLP